MTSIYVDDVMFFFNYGRLRITSDYNIIDFSDSLYNIYRV